MPGADASQYTAFKKYQSAAAKQGVDRLSQPIPRITTAGSMTKFLPSLTIKNATQIANFTVNAITVSLRFIAGVYGAGGNYDSLKAVIATLYSVSVADITNFSVSSGSIVITFTINYTGLVNFTIPSDILVTLPAGLGQAIIQNANTNLSLTNGDKSASFIITTPGGTTNETITDTTISSRPAVFSTTSYLNVPEDINSFTIRATAGGGGGAGAGSPSISSGGGGSGQYVTGTVGVKGGSQIGYKLIIPDGVPNPGGLGGTAQSGSNGTNLEITYVNTSNILKTILLIGGKGGKYGNNSGTAAGGSGGTNPEPSRLTLSNGDSGTGGAVFFGQPIGGAGGFPFGQQSTGIFSAGGGGYGEPGGGNYPRNGGGPGITITFSRTVLI